MAKRDTLATVRVFDSRGEFPPVKIGVPYGLLRRFWESDPAARRSLIIQSVAKYKKELSEINEVLIAEGRSPSHLCPKLEEVTGIEVISYQRDADLKGRA
jgi:hypothetical protein